MRICLLLLLFAVGTARAAEVQVAVAANFAAPMQKIAAAFQRETGHRALLAIGSTGRFYAQVKNGAPFQVLLAADDETPAKLAAEGRAVASSRFTYAIGRLVLWSAQAGVVDAEGKVLRDAGFERLAIADPKVAPYGAAAMDVITRMALPRGVIARIVQGESIGQAFQFVATGNAQLGFVALSQVMVDGRIEKGSAWVVPANLHTPLRQDAILLNTGHGNAAATALLEFLRGDAARAIIRAHGYQFQAK
ncbi:molybdate ABC transporter substrate-binding protein [Caenimonas sedimenti]|uniref:Molybdate ABC transporter substrate-binding protein n=1 Tax=Caenimonas sedimenti TaxID=2596921 RepID=A0A562ZJ95_9BURK|nr:molybdate ABC transporter substrate-binding protein [Caenimonas sedimenti]TWO68398.1 molybdate ABC transporter substrate-binding protein [Caenimonas sedimenti]